MKRLLIVILILVAVALLIGAFYKFFRWREDSHELVLYGNVDVRIVDIGFRVPGKVASLFFEEGDYVKEGTLLCALDRTPYDSQLLQAKANSESIRANLSNSEILLKRRQELVEEESVSQEDVDNALANYNALKANFQAAEAAVQVALDSLSYTEAHAPAEGVILTRVREPGSVVRETDPVYVLSVSSPVWIRAFVAEPDLGRIYFGMPATIYTDTKGGPSYKGRIGFISPISEFTPKTVETNQLRTDLVYRLRIYVDNPDQSLKQGMPVTVKLPTEGRPREQ